MHSKKFLLLFLALLLPGLIFYFLKFFGKNEFNLPVYYEQEMETPAGCAYEYRLPYQVADSISIGYKQIANLFVWHLNEEAAHNLERLQTTFRQDEFRIHAIASSDTTTAQCVVLLKKPWSVALVDAERRVRGYYEPSTREEFDRLKMEMSILLKKY